MKTEEVQSTLGTLPLLLIAGAAVLALLFLIIRVKIHPLIVLPLVSLGTAFAARVPTDEIVDVLIDGFGGTLGEVALLVGFGVMFARIVEISGGAQALSDTMIRLFGEKRAPLALGVASLLFGFPIFFDAALMVMLPIVFAVARRLGGGVLRYALPAAAALSTMHIFLPPHPGAVAATVFLGADVGLVVLLGVLIAGPTWYISGYLYGIWIGGRIVLPVPELLTGGPRKETAGGSGDGSGGDPGGDPGGDIAPPKASTVLLLLLLPLGLIFLNTGLRTAVDTGALAKDLAWADVLRVLGSTPVALLITVITASYVLGTRRGRSRDFLEDLYDNALKPIAPVVLITGAGGMFGSVLVTSGIGDALANTLRDTGLPLIVSTFVVAAILRIALGTATVAITTSAGLLSASVLAAGLNPVQTAAMVLALAGGSAVVPHVNDASFWLFGKLLGMDIPTTFRTWTVIKTLIGVVGFLFAWIVYALAS
ncbi:GntP family permease [Streptomyces corynorhini]|uniref:GntP family permease n=1 Tax=Streptomyces corynorhini TaxID=2282652 RepID=A0A370BAH8_9ACTN|nr:GntP family permease [Streptomyces corynorhini]RDG37389.1 GntP family permease [Streptomyces corynorhini]